MFRLKLSDCLSAIRFLCSQIAEIYSVLRICLIRILFFVCFISLSFYFVEANFESVVSIKIQGVPMRDALMRLANANRVGLFIDRRLDPSTLVSFQADNKTVRQVFQAFADSSGLYCYFLGSVVYIGRAEMRDIFPELVSRHRQFISQPDNNMLSNKSYLVARVKLSKLVNVKLPILSEPKNVLKNLAQQHQFTWQNLDKLPHDVWAENKLPAMPLGEFLILMLVGFDLDYVCELPSGNSQSKDLPDKMILRIIDVAEEKSSINQQTQK
jgi:hypothetical protein